MQPGSRKALYRSVAPMARMKIKPVHEISHSFTRSLKENERLLSALFFLISAWATSLTLVIV